MSAPFREVSKAEFFEGIGNQNVHPQIQPPMIFPYTELWLTPHREVRGKTVGYIPDGGALEKTRYYLPGAPSLGGNAS